MGIEESLVKKISGKQAYRLLFLLLISGVVLGAYSIYANKDEQILQEITKVSQSVQRTEKIREREIVNLLDKQGALLVYEKVFDSARGEITELMMKIISKNHLNNVSRQKDITRTVQRSVRILYAEDSNSLSIYTYKNRPLDIVMLDIDPEDVSAEMINYLFENAKQSHVMLAEETVRMLKIKFSGFLNQANDYLNKIDKSTSKR